MEVKITNIELIPKIKSSFRSIFKTRRNPQNFILKIRGTKLNSVSKFYKVTVFSTLSLLNRLFFLAVTFSLILISQNLIEEKLVG